MDIFRKNNFTRTCASGMNFSAKNPEKPCAEKLSYLVNPYGKAAHREKIPGLYSFPRSTPDWVTDYYVNSCVEDIIDGRPGTVYNDEQLDLVVTIMAELNGMPDNNEKSNIIPTSEEPLLEVHELDRSTYDAGIDCWRKEKLGRTYYVVAPTGTPTDIIKRY